MSDNTIKILVFGQLTETIGSSLLELPFVHELGTLKEELYKRYPQLRERRFVLAVNKLICLEDHKLQVGDEVAVLPPFSGG